MVTLQVAQALAWPTVTMMVLIVQFVTICFLRRRVRKLEEY